MGDEWREPTPEERARVGRIVLGIALLGLGVVVVIRYGGVLPWQEIAAVVLVSALVGAVVAQPPRTRTSFQVAAVLGLWGGMALVGLVLERREWVGLYAVSYFAGLCLSRAVRSREDAR